MPIPQALDFELAWAMQPAAFAALMTADPAAEGGAAAAVPFMPEEGDNAPYTVADGVAVIPIEGIITRTGGPWYAPGTGLQTLHTVLGRALSDPAVRAILFSVYSPGGQATGVKEMAEAIFAARAVKPCAAYVDGLCCSGAYWLAAATGRVYAGASATVGSIGVVCRHMDKSGWNKQIGLNYTYVTAGAYKASGNPDSALSERDLGVLQGRVNAIYEMFADDVAKYMGLAREQQQIWADGQDFLADEAANIGLVTAILPGRASAMRQLVKETHMNKLELATKHPELLAEIEQAVTAQARKDAESKLAAQGEAEKEELLALFEAVCGKETTDKVRGLVATGVRPEQLAAMQAVLGAPSKTVPQTSQEEFKVQMLAAVEKATPPALPDGGAASGQSDAAAAIARIAAL